MRVKEKSMRALFEADEFKQWKKSSTMVVVLAIAFVWAGIILDRMVYPRLAGDFFVYRMLASALLVMGLVLIRMVRNPWQLRLLNHLLILVPVFFIELMVHKAADPFPFYYGGINVVLVGAALLLRWRWTDSLLNVTICVLSFFALMNFSKVGMTYRGGLIPSYFVLVTGVIAVLATYFYDASRFREYCLVKEVQDTNAKLRAIDETKARFFANISHELRTPLTLILGPLENLRIHKRYKKDTLLGEHLDMIEDNSMRLLRLINDILDLVKLDSDESPPRPELIKVCDFIEGLANNLKPVADLKHISLSSRCNDVEQEMVWLDRDRLEKIVLNLAVNAVKFTAAGGDIILGAETRDQHLILTVKDNGEGMSEEAMSNVFVRFWQADMSAKRKHRGAGIGLALVKSLTESMQGDVTVESELGKGTVFTVKLPAPETRGRKMKKSDSEPHDILERFNEQARLRGVVRSSGDKVAMPVLDEGQDDGRVNPRSQRKKKRILVAEDEDAMRTFIVRQLEDFEVIEAQDGKQAWKLAQKFKPDLMILDFMMPGHDGVELTRLIRSHEVISRTPIILVTAQAGESARFQALEAGVNDFLTKPFSSVELLVRARNLLSSSEFEMQLAESHDSLESAYGQLKEQEAVLVQTEKLSSLGRMSAGIVHEINNPLNYTHTALYALKSFERMLPADEKEDYLDVLGDAREGVDRVVGIVKGLRSFTRGDSAQMSDVVLADVIESARKLSGEVMKGIHFHSKVSTEWVVQGNEIQLCQLFVNLIQNAVRAIQVSDNRDGESSIDVSAEAYGDAELKVILRDNGCGISEEDIERIFDPFFTKNDVGEGLGLGLSISYRIINQHQARIEVQSEVGEYTDFIIFFKLDRD